MLDLNCVHCGSSNLHFLGNNHQLITSQNEYQELAILKKQKEKQLKDTKKLEPTKYYFKNIKNKINKKNTPFNAILFSVCFFTSYAIWWYIFNESFDFLYTVLAVIFSIPLLIYLVYFITIIIDLFKLPLFVMKIEKEITNYQDNIRKINKKIKTWSNLYYCDDCNQVMDLKTKLYDSPENINKLVSKLYDKK